MVMAGLPTLSVNAKVSSEKDELIEQTSESSATCGQIDTDMNCGFGASEIIQSCDYSKSDVPNPDGFIVLNSYLFIIELIWTLM